MRGGEWKEIGSEPHCAACHANKEGVYGPRGPAAGRTSVTEDAGPTAPPELPTAPPEGLPTAPAEPVEEPEAAALQQDEDAEERESKPMSLKERMAALQKSQDKDKALSKDATPRQAKAKVGGRFSTTAPICPSCSTRVYPAEEVKGPGGNSWHALCFCCTACGKSMRGGQWRENAGEPYCQTCHCKLFGIKGVGYGNTLVDTGAQVTPEESQPVASADEPEDTKSMSLKERATAFQAAADASSSKGAIQPEKQSDDAQEEAAGSELQDKTTAEGMELMFGANKRVTNKRVLLDRGRAAPTSEAQQDKSAAEAENNGDAAQNSGAQQDKTAAEAENNADASKTSEAQPCMEHTNGETLDHEIAKDETKAGAGNAPKEEAKVDLPSEKPMSLKERTRAFQAAADASASKSFSFQPEQRSSDAKEEAARSELQNKIIAETENSGDAAQMSESQPCMEHTNGEAVDHDIAKDETKAGAGDAPKEEAKIDLPSATCKDEIEQAPAIAVTEQGEPEPAISTEEVQAEVNVASSEVEAADTKSKQQGQDQAMVATSAPAEQSATPVSEPPQEGKAPESSTPAGAADQPCGNYRVDVTASNFGDCKCGFAKKAHEAQQSGEAKCIPVPSGSMPEKTSAPEPGDVDGKPCSKYRLDVAGKSFGDCKCGFSKAAHEAQQAEETRAKCIPVPSDSIPQETSEMAAQPCSNYRLDLKGKSFGDCKCGFPKSKH